MHRNMYMHVWGAMCLLLLSACQTHFISNADERNEAEQRFEQRREALSDTHIFEIFSEEMTREENEAMRFLYAYMPLGDLTDYDGGFHLAHVQAALRARNEMPWGKEGKDDLDNKYLYVCHAEFNAILNSYAPVKGCILYVTMFPCNECAKAIIQSGIKEVVYMTEKYPDSQMDRASKRLLLMAGIPFRLYEGRKLDIRVEE